MFGKYTCRKCKDPPKRFNFKGDCRRHIISYHYGFQYKCTGCGVMNSRKPEGTKHKCVKPGGEHILYHRETGSMGPEARKLLNQMNDKVDMDMEETIHFSQRPISPIRDPVLLGSHPYLPRPPVFERYKVQKVVKDTPKQKSTLASMPSLEDLTIPENVDFLAEKTASESVVLPEVEITEEDMAAVISSPARKVVVHQNSSEITKEQTVPVDAMPTSEAPDYIDHFKRVLPQISELKEWNTYENRVALCNGGKCFDTTSSTLMKEPTSVLALISGLAAIKSDNKIFIDRDPSHFKFILNYLRYNLRMPAGCLPADPQVLHELRQEAEYYLLPKLVETIDWKIKSLRCTPAKQ